jgi:hypothetical protein
MKLPEGVRQLLLETLLANGWTVEGDFIYAPRRTIWLLCADPWQGDLADMLERMQGRLQRIYNLASAEQDRGSSQDAIDDTAGLVRVLQTLWQPSEGD